MGPGAVCPAPPDNVPMCPSSVVNGKQVQPCMEDFLAPVPGKVSESCLFTVFSLSSRGKGTLQQHVTLLDHVGDLSSAASSVATAYASAEAFQG